MSHDRSNSEKPFEIMVKKLGGGLLFLECADNETIGSLKKMISTKEKIPIEQIRLISAGREGKDEQHVKEFKDSDFRFNLVIRHALVTAPSSTTAISTGLSSPANTFAAAAQTKMELREPELKSEPVVESKRRIVPLAQMGKTESYNLDIDAKAFMEAVFTLPTGGLLKKNEWKNFKDNFSPEEQKNLEEVRKGLAEQRKQAKKTGAKPQYLTEDGFQLLETIANKINESKAKFSKGVLEKVFSHSDKFLKAYAMKKESELSARPRR